jgi:hypothetical protein
MQMRRFVTAAALVVALASPTSASQMQLPTGQWTNLGSGPLVLSAEVETLQYIQGSEPPESSLPPGYTSLTVAGKLLVPGQGSVTAPELQNVYVAPIRPGAVVVYSTP